MLQLENTPWICLGQPKVSAVLTGLDVDSHLLQKVLMTWRSSQVPFPVDGRPVDMVNIPLFTGVFIHPRWLALGISEASNSMIRLVLIFDLKTKEG